MSDREKLNIERVFVGMRRAWHPPSTAIESSFTRLTRSLSEIFGRLQSDPDLAPLHGELYAELREREAEAEATDEPVATDAQVPLPLPLPAPEPGSYFSDRTQRRRSRREARKAFYLCNSMIQLMEDVYLDLRLEAEHRHPDNHGWMNLFRRWSRALTFRQAWAVSAPTYGLRFQDFCQRHMALASGRTGLTQVYHRRKDAAFPDDRARALLESWEIDVIRVLQRRRTRGQENPLADDFRKVVAGRLVVPGSPNAGPDLQLTYGVAILDAAGRVLAFWVRQHLRNRGLGRQLMSDLITRMGVPATRLASASVLERLGLPAFNLERIGDLFKSAHNEMRLEESQLAMAPDPVRQGELAPLPALAYTGFIRPRDASWAHALALLCWLVAWLPESEIAVIERQEMNRILKGWLRGRLLDQEMQELFDDAEEWSRGRTSRALELELEAVLTRMSAEEWFRRNRYPERIERDLLQIAWADARRTPEEVRLIQRVAELLDLERRE